MLLSYNPLCNADASAENECIAWQCSRAGYMLGFTMHFQYFLLINLVSYVSKHVYLLTYYKT